MTRPSITPHEDAFRQTIARRPAPKDDTQAATFRIIETATLEYARAMDAGRGTKECFRICISACASMIATLCYSATAKSDQKHDDDAAKLMMAYTIAELASTIGADPVSMSSATVDQTRPVRA